MSSFVLPSKLPIVEPRSDYINEFEKMGIVAWYDLKRDRGNKIFNLMGKSKDFPNQIPSNHAPMNIDSNSDNVVDGFISENPVVTAVYSVDDSAQKIDITVHAGGGYAAVRYISVSLTAGETLSLSVDTKILNNIVSRLYVQWYNGATKISNSTITNSSSTSWTTLENLNLTAPATTTHAIILCQANVTDGNLGAVWFRNLRVVKAATVNCVGHTNAIVGGATNHPLGKFFDGIDDSCAAPNNEIFNIVNKLSIIIFLKVPSTLGNAYAALFGRSGGYDLGINGGISRLSLRGTSVIDTLASGVDIRNDKWNMVAFSCNNTSITHYLNGVFKYTVTGTWTPTLSSFGLYIGQRDAYPSTFTGVIGDVLLSNKTLSAGQVSRVGKMLGWQYPGLAIA
jgi:hypothetical protein